MKLRPAPRYHCFVRAAGSTQGSARLVLLVLAAFLLGAGLAAVWFHGHQVPPRAVAQAPAEAQARLSESTRAVLARINRPVEVRFYALLDPATATDATHAFAQRVGQLLALYEGDAAGKLKVSRIDASSGANANAAAADGLQSFSVGSGQACYLGVVFASQGQKELLPHLSPEFEAALESDLTRGLARLLESARASGAPAAVSQVDTAAEQQVHTLIPDLSTVSVEQGTRLIRAAALKAFQAAAAEMQTRVQEAQQQLAEAQNGKSEAEQQAAMQHLQQVQADQAAKLKEISAQAQAQIEALERLKRL